MAYRVLEVTIQSAKDLKRVNLLSRMEVYAVVSISGDPLARQCTPADPYGGRHPCWNSTFRFNVPADAAGASGCLHVLLRTERALGDRDVGEVVVPLADVLACAGDPGPWSLQCASYTVRKVHRWEPRGTLLVSYRLGAVVEPPPQQKQQARRGDEEEEHGAAVVAYPVARPLYHHPSPYGYLPPPPALQAAYTGGGGQSYPPSSAAPSNAHGGSFPAPAYSSPQAADRGRGAVHRPPPASSAGPVVSTYGSNKNNPAAAAYSQAPAGGGYAAAAPPTKGDSDGGKQVDFGLVSGGAIGGMLASDMMAEAAAYSYGYRAGLADGGGVAAYKNSHVPTKVCMCNAWSGRR